MCKVDAGRYLDNHLDQMDMKFLKLKIDENSTLRYDVQKHFFWNLSDFACTTVP